MADTPDLQKVISVIMENPSLVAEISSLLSGKGDTGEDIPKNSVAAELPEATAADTEPAVSRTDESRRNKLLLAMKPYLSKERQNAMDTVITVLDVLHTVRGR